MNTPSDKSVRLTRGQVEGWREWIKWKLQDLHDDDRASCAPEVDTLCDMALAALSTGDALEYARVLLTCARADWYRPPYSQLKQDIDKFLDTPRDGGREEPLTP